MTVAYQLTEAGTQLSRTTVERRPLGPRDVRLDLKFCGICHSDLVAASDKLGGGMFPMVPGHEMVGVITEMGTDVTGVAMGDTVGVGCIADSCRTCSCVKQAMSTTVKRASRSVLTARIARAA